MPTKTENLLSALERPDHHDAVLRSVDLLKDTMTARQFVSMTPMLPLLLSLKGKPYTLEQHFPFEPFFRTRTPRRTVFKTARQVAKSTCLASQGVLRVNCIPHYSILYVTPLCEMTRRFSHNYVRPFIETSPLRGVMVDSSCVQSVQQKTFRNHSMMHFSFAFLDAERTRGISATQLSIDEVQNMDYSLIPIMRETMGGVPGGGVEQFAGTPKSLENCIQNLWIDSSQAEWVTRCNACRHWNVPTLDADLDKMIGPWHDDISAACPGVVCAKCSRPIFPHTGRWVHTYPERRWAFAGYHIPQIVMPVHYTDSEKWALLHAKRQGRGGTTAAVFYNEVCGESYDTGSRIITLTELQAAADLPWPNLIDDAVKHIDEYTYRVLGVDWGGGGEDEISFTTMAVLGIAPNGDIHVLWGMRSLHPHDHEHEARLCLGAIRKFKCHALAHDYSGAGSLRETFIVQSGYPLDRVIPISYIRAGMSARVMQYKQATRLNPRAYYQVDKTRSLLLTCNQIKHRQIRFFKWDRVNSEDPGLISDFLALVDEKVNMRIGRDVFTIIRDPALSDDFAHSVNLGACTLWHMTDRWPNIAAIAAMRLDPDLLPHLGPGEPSE